VTDGLHHGDRFAHDEVSIPRLTIRRWRSSRRSPSTPLLQSGGNVPPRMSPADCPVIATVQPHPAINR